MRETERTLLGYRTCSNGAKLGMYQIARNTIVYSWVSNAEMTAHKAAQQPAQSDEPKNQIEALTAALNEAGLKARIWNNSRIYINGQGRDIKAYLELDNPASTSYGSDLLDGSALKVWSDANQARNWLINRCKQVKWNIMNRMAEAEMTECCSTWQSVIL